MRAAVLPFSEEIDPCLQVASIRLAIGFSGLNQNFRFIIGHNTLTQLPEWFSIRMDRTED